jgi:hypothetical protein
MWCEDDDFVDTMSITGTDVKQIKMNFEQDGNNGVAIKFRNRDDGLLWKTGVRDFSIEADWNNVWEIPDDEELIGFHGKEKGFGIDM